MSPRTLVILVALAVLVGGLAGAQQIEEQLPLDRDESSPNPVLVEQARQDGLGLINDRYEGPVPSPQEIGAIGRYQLAADGQRMLDTATGTLYSLVGEEWAVLAILPSARSVVRPTTSADTPRMEEQLAHLRAELQEVTEELTTVRDADERERLDRQRRFLARLLERLEARARARSGDIGE
jgi:hypothetical protein